MMSTEHPITPPPELVRQWAVYMPGHESPEQLWLSVATQAARWGANQELEACCEWLQGNDPYEHDYPQMLRTARRPKPPSLKRRALEALEDHEIEWLKRSSIIRRALEQIDD